LRKSLLYLALIALLTIPAVSQIVAAPQYELQLNALGGGIYGTTTATNTVFNYQFTTNSKLEADLLVAPGGGLNSYQAGSSYGLCGIKSIENALALTSLNCGKIDPFVAATAGIGRVQQGSSPTVEGFAAMAKVGIGLPSASGSYSVAFVGAYGDFGPKIAGQSNKGFVFYSGVTFGAGNSAAATQAKIARRQASEAKKQARLKARMDKAKAGT
jgi:hypothetical protein